MFDRGACRVGDEGYVDLGVSSCLVRVFQLGGVVLVTVGVLSLLGLEKLPLLPSFRGETRGVLLPCLRGEGETGDSGRRKGELRGEP